MVTMMESVEVGGATSGRIDCGGGGVVSKLRVVTCRDRTTEADRLDRAVLG